MKIKIINKSGYPNPAYETPLSSGCDLRAVLSQPITLQPLDRVTVMTGIHIALPEGYEAQVRPRSGLTRKNGIVAAFGTVDCDYRGEIGVTLMNLSHDDFTVRPGERIAQLVIVPFEQAEWEDCNELDSTERGTKGFGSSGMK